jgi:hypothetical protein
LREDGFGVSGRLRRDHCPCVARTGVSSANVAMVVVGRLGGQQCTGGPVAALGRCLGKRQRGLETGCGA